MTTVERIEFSGIDKSDPTGLWKMTGIIHLSDGRLQSHECFLGGDLLSTRDDDWVAAVLKQRITEFAGHSAAGNMDMTA